MCRKEMKRSGTWEVFVCPVRDGITAFLRSILPPIYFLLLFVSVLRIPSTSHSYFIVRSLRRTVTLHQNATVTAR